MTINIMAILKKINYNVEHSPVNNVVKNDLNAWETFTAWTIKIEDYRFPILATLGMFQIIIISPVILLLSLFFDIGLSDLTIIVVTATSMAVMVTSMAGLSCRIVIINFAFSIIANSTIIFIYIFSIFSK